MYWHTYEKNYQSILSCFCNPTATLSVKYCLINGTYICADCRRLEAKGKLSILMYLRFSWDCVWFKYDWLNYSIVRICNCWLEYHWNRTQMKELKPNLSFFFLRGCHKYLNENAKRFLFLVQASAHICGVMWFDWLLLVVCYAL